MSKFVEIKTCYAVLISLSDGKCILLDIVKDWIIAAILKLYPLKNDSVWRYRKMI